MSLSHFMLISGVYGSELKNVREGDLVELKCKFTPPADSPLDSTDLTWIRDARKCFFFIYMISLKKKVFLKTG